MYGVSLESYCLLLSIETHLERVNSIFQTEIFADKDQVSFIAPINSRKVENKLDLTLLISIYHL